LTGSRLLAGLLAGVGLLAPVVVLAVTGSVTRYSELEQYSAISPDSLDAQIEWITGDAPGFAAACDSAFAQDGLDDTADAAFLEATAGVYFQATSDSLLFQDLAFVRSASAEARTVWLDGVTADRDAAGLRAQGQHPAAAEAHERAALAYREAGHLRREAVAWGSLGVSFWFSGDFPNVKRAYGEALTARERLGDPVLIGRTLNGLGSANFQTADYDSALAWYGRARAVRETLPNKVDLGVTVSYIGNVYFRMGRLVEAREAYAEALGILGPDAPARRRTPALVGLANVHWNLGEFEEALVVYREQLDLAVETGDIVNQALMRRNIAQTLQYLGDYTNALQELLLAVPIQEIEDPGSLPDTYITLGNVYRQLADPGAALRVYGEAGRIAEETENPRAKAEAMANLGATYAEMGIRNRALRSFDEALVLYAELDDEPGRRNALTQKADFLQTQGEYDEALVICDEALALDRGLGMRARVAEDLINRGSALAATGRFAEAREALNEALVLGGELGRPDVEGHAYLNLADILDQEGRLDSARVYNARAIDIMENAWDPTLSAETKAAFLGNRAYIYEAQVHVLARMDAAAPGEGYREESFAAAERGKARALLDMLNESRVDLSADEDTGLAARARDLERALGTVNYLLREAAANDVPPDSLKALKKRRRDLERERQDLGRSRRLADPRLASLDPGRPFTVDEVREALLGGTDVLLEYALGDSASYLWVVTREDLRLITLPPRAELEAPLARLRSSLLNPADRDFTFRDDARDLYDLVLAPAVREVGRADRVLLIPDGALHFLPFDVLLDGDDEYPLAGRRLSYGPSATTLAVLAGYSSDQRATRDLLIVADPAFGEAEATAGLAPLPQTRAEAEAIAANFDSAGVTLLLGEDARAETLRAPGYLSDYRILHFATHALVDERRPERSAIALARPRDEREDGFLRADEIYPLDIRAELVVLSACETGLGKQVRGEGVLGLPRAFFYAGSPRVVVSLWSVSDRSTAVLMSAFYRHLEQHGQSPAEALARAKVELRSKPEFAHPFHWAPFELMGPDIRK